jgi:hypothetical protein
MYTVPTVKIVSEQSHENPLGYIVINKADFDPSKHEPFDEDDAAALAGAIKSGELVPSMAELLAARDQLEARKRDLDAEADRLAEQAAANEAEAQRLAAMATTSTAPDFSAMTKDELQAALTAKGISFPAAANKADLVALLTA